jgi:hypothetical protein
MSDVAIRKFTSFASFYLGEHNNATYRMLHFIGSSIALTLTLYALWSRR